MNFFTSGDVLNCILTSGLQLLYVVYRWMHLSFLNYSVASVAAVTYRAGNQPQQYSPSGGGRFAGARLPNGSEKAADGLDSLVRKH